MPSPMLATWPISAISGANTVAATRRCAVSSHGLGDVMRGFFMQCVRDPIQICPP